MYRNIFVNIWWEDASIHYLVTTLGSDYSKTPSSSYWCSGMSAGERGYGDVCWSRGKPASAEIEAAANFAYAYYRRQQDHALHSWTEDDEQDYEKYLAQVGAQGSRYGPIFNITVNAYKAPYISGPINPGRLLEEMEATTD
jgi:hypothetical protein